MFRWTRQVRESGFSLMVATNHVIDAHSHDPLEFAYILHGTMEHRIYGKTQILRAGDYFIVDHGVDHSYRRIGGQELHVLNLLFYPWFIDRGLAKTSSFADVMNSYLLRLCYKNLQFPPEGMTFTDESGQVRTLLEHIRREFEEKGLGYLEYIRGALVDVLILTVRKLEARQFRQADDPLIRQICLDMEKNYLQKLSLADYAQAHGYSLSHLSRLFHAQTGLRFTQYLQQLRLRFCCHQLETTGKSVSVIAQEAGYENQKYFNELFRRHFSMTPTQFRALQRSVR